MGLGAGGKEKVFLMTTTFTGGEYACLKSIDIFCRKLSHCFCLLVGSLLFFGGWGFKFVTLCEITFNVLISVAAS